VRGNHPSRRAKEPRWNKQQHVFSARRWPPPVSTREAEVGPRGGRLGREGLSPLPRNGWRPPPLTDSSGGAERRLHAGAPVNTARVSVNARADVHAPVAGRRPINELAWTHPAEAGGRVVQIRPQTTRRRHRMEVGISNATLAGCISSLTPTALSAGAWCRRMGTIFRPAASRGRGVRGALAPATGRLGNIRLAGLPTLGGSFDFRDLIAFSFTSAAKRALGVDEGVLRPVVRSCGSASDWTHHSKASGRRQAWWSPLGWRCALRHVSSLTWSGQAGMDYQNQCIRPKLG
jgi:hypothetical protein